MFVKTTYLPRSGHSSEIDKVLGMIGCLDGSKFGIFLNDSSRGYASAINVNIRTKITSYTMLMSTHNLHDILPLYETMHTYEKLNYDILLSVVSSVFLDIALSTLV